MHPFIPIVILNWNGWKDTLACIQSLLNISYSSFAIIIVDNGSQDKSVKMIRQFCLTHIDEQKKEIIPQIGIPIHYEEYSRGDKSIYPENEKTLPPSQSSVILLKNEKNEGYAEGNNLGIRYALERFNPDYILILNNDTVVHPDFLSALTEIAEKCPSGGFFGPKTYYYNLPGEENVLNSVGETVIMGMVRPVHTGDKRPDPQGILFRTVRVVDFITGSCVLVRKSVLDEVGFLDPDYFLYWEDADWCLRGRKHGFMSIYIPKSIIWHKIGSSNIGFNNYYYYIRNRFVFCRKNGKKWQQIIFFLYFFPFELPVSCFAQLLYYRSLKRFIALWRGVRDGAESFIN
jgi:GT2 family glycosyltransferase